MLLIQNSRHFANFPLNGKTKWYQIPTKFAFSNKLFESEISNLNINYLKKTLFEHRFQANI